MGFLQKKVCGRDFGKTEFSKENKKGVLFFILIFQMAVEGRECLPQKRKQKQRKK